MLSSHLILNLHSSGFITKFMLGFLATYVASSILPDISCLKNWVTYIHAQGYANFLEFLLGGPENLPALKFS
jgi:hypothetical protein